MSVFEKLDVLLLGFQKFGVLGLKRGKNSS